MIEPLLSDDALLADIAAVPWSLDRLDLWWLGQSGFLLKWNGRFVLLDPYLSESLTAKYAKSDHPHVRMIRRVIDPARLGFVELVTSTHNHTDHLDGETLKPLIAANPKLKLIIPAANRAFVAQRLGIDPQQPIGLNDDGKRAEFDGMSFQAVPAAHETIDREEAGQLKCVGYVVRLGPFTVYHSGDTLLYDGMADLLKPMNIDLALLPINGRDPARGVAGNLDGIQAANLARDMGAKRVIPCHYDMFEFNTASPDLFVRECIRLGVEQHVLKAGQRFTINS